MIILKIISLLIMFMFVYYVCKFYSNERIPLYRTYWIIMLILLSIPMLYIVLN